MKSFVRMGLLAFAVFAGACRRPAASSTCTLTDGRTLDVAGRGDGVYGVEGERVLDAPLARFDRMKLMSQGTERSSGKPWIQVEMPDDEAERVARFTSAPQNRSIAVVVGGEVACQHKLRDPITSARVQVSCCNPRACDRWRALLGEGKPRQR